MTPYENFKALFLSGFESFRALKITLFERSRVLKVENFMALFLSVSEYCQNPTNKTKQNKTTLVGVALQLLSREPTQLELDVLNIFGN